MTVPARPGEEVSNLRPEEMENRGRRGSLTIRCRTGSQVAQALRATVTGSVASRHGDHESLSANVPLINDAGRRRRGAHAW